MLTYHIWGILLYTHAFLYTHALLTWTFYCICHLFVFLCFADDAHGEETFGGKKKMTWVTACIYSGLELLCAAILSLGRSTCAKFRACNKISKLLILTLAVLFHWWPISTEWSNVSFVCSTATMTKHDKTTSHMCKKNRNRESEIGTHMSSGIY